MERVAEFIGKKVQDAVDEGLKTLGISLDDADIKIISNGGLFKKAKVEIRYDDKLAKNPPVEQKKEEFKKEEPKKAEPKQEETKREECKKEQPKVEESAKKQKQETKPRENKAAEPEDEPRWGSAPVKREPTTVSDFGKERKEPKKEERREPRPKKQRETALPTEEQIAAAKDFVTELLAKMNIAGGVEIVVEDGMRVNIDTDDSRIIGHRGEVLDSIRQFLSAMINTTHGNFVHVTVDGLGYRDRRKETLESLARRMADKAVRSHRKVTLDPMNSADRRIVHAALGERDDVFTRSEGHDPARRVAIIPKRK